MQNIKSKAFTNWFVALSLAALTASLQAEVVKYESQPGSKVKIEGTSTFHDWVVDGQIISGFMEIDSSFAKEALAKTEPGYKLSPKVEVMIPVRSLKSGKPKMDEVMHEALKEKQFKRIEFRLDELVLKSAPKSSTGPYAFDAKGELTVAGTKKTIEMPVTLERLDDNRIKVAGQANLKMTQFGVKPPSPSLLGALIKTGDDVKVSFDWVSAEVKKTAQAP